MTERTDLDHTDVAARRTVTLAEVLRVPLRRRWFPLGGALLGVLASVAYLFLPATYEATAVVAVRPVVTNPFSYPGPGADRVVNMTVENSLATGSEVATAVSAATGQGIEDARDRLTVELPVGSQVLRFRYRAQSSNTAISGANAAANAYLRLRQSIYQRQREAIVASYDATITKVSAQRNALRKSLGPVITNGGSVQADRLRGLNDNLARLAERRADAVAVDLTPGTLTQVAVPPVPSSHDNGILYAVLALLGGALAGAVAAYGREAVDRRVRSAVDASAATGLPLLAELRGGRDQARRDADQRYLALAILGQLGPVPHRQIVLLSGRPGDLGGDTATGLALALAEQGHRVRWEDRTADAETSQARILAAASDSPPQDPADSPALDETAPAKTAPDETVPAKTTQDETKRDKVESVKAEPDDIDVAETVILRPVTPVLLAERVAEPATPVRVGAGRVWLSAPEETDETLITLVRAEPTDRDDHGVRAAVTAAAVVVVRRDRTRVADVQRLAERLRLSGARALGVVLVSGRD